MEGGDSNAEILPPKRSNKKKRANEVLTMSKNMALFVLVLLLIRLIVKTFCV